MKYQIFSCLLACIFCVAGCGLGNSNTSVSGKITFEDGTPLTSGEVIFASVDSDSYFAKGKIGNDGTYSLKEQIIGQESNKIGCKKGEFKVFIASTSNTTINEDGTASTTHIINQDYSDKDKTPLTANVPNGKYDFTIPPYN
jgi:hypothetical protein